MAELTALRRNIQIEEARFRFAVSESWAQKLGGSINFINNYHHAVKEWNINGVYGAMSLPFLGIDGFHPVLYDLEILSIFMFCQTAGSGGTTEIDIKKGTTSGGSFSTIFSTTPKIASTAGSNSWIQTGGSGSGLTAPVLISSNLSAGDVLRCDLVAAQSGEPNGTGLVILHRPR
jgi:hypothetical protein